MVNKCQRFYGGKDREIIEWSIKFVAYFLRSKSTTFWHLRSWRLFFPPLIRHHYDNLFPRVIMKTRKDIFHKNSSNFKWTITNDCNKYCQKHAFCWSPQHISTSWINQDSAVRGWRIACGQLRNVENRVWVKVQQAEQRDLHFNANISESTRWLTLIVNRLER